MAPTLEQIVGRNIRHIRVTDDMTQDQIAAWARVAGLKWTQSTVAALEAGTKTLDLVEFVALAVWCPGLLMGDPEERVKLGTLTIALEVVQLGLATAVGPLRALAKQPATGSPSRQAELAARGEAEQKASRKLKVDALLIAKAAYKLWGRSLTEERDARVAESAPAGTSTRSRQALRGRVTRVLLEELEPRLARTARKPLTKGS